MWVAWCHGGAAEQHRNNKQKDWKSGGIRRRNILEHQEPNRSRVLHGLTPVYLCINHQEKNL